MSCMVYTILDLSRLTGITDRTLRKYIHTGTLRGILRDGKWVFTYEQLHSFITDPNNEKMFKFVRNSVYNRYISKINKDSPTRFVYIDIPECDEKTLHELIDAAALTSQIQGVTYCFYVSDGIAHLT